MSFTKVKDLIKKPLITIDKSCTIKEAINVMARENIGFLVITDRNELFGVISERDIIKALAKGIDINESIEKIAIRNVITIKDSEPLWYAAKLMSQYKIRHLVVVNSENKPS